MVAPLRKRTPTSRGKRCAAFVFAVALLVPATASAQSRTLGSPLTQAPNATFGCETKPTFTAESFSGDYFYLPSSQPDCTWFLSFDVSYWI